VTRTANDVPPEKWRKRQARILRLKERVKQAAAVNRDDPVPGILAGILDLMDDDRTAELWAKLEDKL